MSRQVQTKVMPRTWQRHIPEGDVNTVRVDRSRRLWFKAGQERQLGLVKGTRLTVVRTDWGYELNLCPEGDRLVSSSDVRADGSDKCMISFGKRLPAGEYPCLMAEGVIRIYKEVLDGD